MTAPHAGTDFPWKNLPDCDNPRLPIEHLIQCAYDKAKKHPQTPELDLITTHLEECLQLMKQLHARLHKEGQPLSREPWCYPAQLSEAMRQRTG
jgi:hypothetical protein